MITIKTFAFPTQATVVVSALEAEGIHCFLQDEITLQADPILTNAIGGVKLKVKKEDQDRAIKYLAEHGYLEENTAPDSHQRLLDFISSNPKYIFIAALGLVILAYLFRSLYNYYIEQ